MDIDALHRRREARRLAIRRRRMIAAGLIAALLATVAVIAALASSDGGSPSTAQRSTVHSSAPAGHTPPQSATAVEVRRGPPGTEAVPILIYHVIAAPPAGAPFPGLYVPPSEFAAQMQALKSAGWRALTLDQVQAYWQHGAPLPKGKPIVVSFDNGYHSQFAEALPILKRLGWVGDESIQLTGLPPSQGGLSESEVRGLIAAGWELDTQGISHADLITLNATRLHEQVASARATIQQRYHVPVNWFCYPSGHYDATVIAAVKAAGYQGSTTVIPGWADPDEDRYRLHRLRVLGGTTPAGLLALIAGTRNDPPAPASYNGT
jgi:peptidoglycan/xylan/chitin deacetylase (PgdA/CDA1 family)